MHPQSQSTAISIYGIQQKLFWMLVSCIVVVVAFYFYIVGQTILSVVDRRTADSEITNTNSKISELESQYIALGQSIDSTLATNEGFQNISKIEFVSRSNTVTMRDDAR